MEKTICFDLDGTLIDSQCVMLSEASKSLTNAITLSDWITYNPKHCFNEEQYNALLDVWTKEEIYLKAKPFEYASAVTNALAKRGYDVVINTYSGGNNYEDLTEYKHACLNKNGIIFSDFISSKSFKPDIQCKILVEDCYDNLVNSSAVIKLLVDRPWNQNVDLDSYGIQRIMSLAEVLAYL